MFPEEEPQLFEITKSPGFPAEQGYWTFTTPSKFECRVNYIACGIIDPYVIGQGKIAAAFFGGVGIAMGGARVIRTVGERITTLTNTRGYSVDFAAATTVLVASKFGMPVSTTHAAVGGVLGVGLARGLEAVNFSVVFKIMLYWVLTVPAAALTSMLIFKMIESIV